ncbi:hypothetical protein TNCV_2034201 [Trichonephila clavipes]|nr:hypothetical protein TNCV_2034201 [Trichonephila clavipes]
MRRHATTYHHFCRVLCGLQTLRAEFLMSASSYIGPTLDARNTKLLSSLNITFSQSLIVHNECSLAPVNRLLRSNSASYGFEHALQPRNPISSSLHLTVLRHTFTFDVKVHCFKVCKELSFLFESEILCNNLSSRKDVYPDRAPCPQ